MMRELPAASAHKRIPEPLSVRIPEAVKLTGISRSRLYELIQEGDLEIVKVGRSTLIPYRSLKALVRG
jgi:excisionase family DNA binding protein